MLYKQGQKNQYKIINRSYSFLTSYEHKRYIFDFYNPKIHIFQINLPLYFKYRLDYQHVYDIKEKKNNIFYYLNVIM